MNYCKSFYGEREILVPEVSWHAVSWQIVVQRVYVMKLKNSSHKSFLKKSYGKKIDFGCEGWFACSQLAHISAHGAASLPWGEREMY